MDDVDISLVIPVYNEEESLPVLMAEIDDEMALHKNYEVIFIDDGSSDRSLKTLIGLKEKYPRIRVIKLRSRSGQTSAMDAGFRRARGKVVITMDADLQNDPADINKLLSELDEYDIVIGWRADREDTWVKRMSSRIANLVRNRITEEDIKDVGCTLKAYKREFLERVKLYNGMHRFLPTLFKMEGARVREVKVNHRPRRYGKSKYNIRNRLFNSIYDLLAVRWMKRRRLTYEIEEEF